MNEWRAVLSKSIESVAQAGLGTRTQFARLEKKVREDWELDKKIAELLRPNRRWRSKFCIQCLAVEYVVYTTKVQLRKDVVMTALVYTIRRCG